MLRRAAMSRSSATTCALTWTARSTLRSKAGANPVVEQALQRTAARSCERLRFIAAIGHGRGRIYVVTGPNMAGKSTFLRQNALYRGAGADGEFRPARRGAHRRDRIACVRVSAQRTISAAALDTSTGRRDRSDRSGGSKRAVMSATRAAPSRRSVALVRR